MTSDQLVTVILGILGVVLQLLLKYAPKISDWYVNNPRKGLWALIFSALIGAGYYGLSCTPYAAQFNIALVCNQDGLFTLGKAIFTIAGAQQLTYLYTRG